jgi:metal-responsive CopG/Arc/MetJ family transcriptional regulator
MSTLVDLEIEDVRVKHLKKRVTYTIDEGLSIRFEKLAKKEVLNRSAVVEQLIKLYLEKKEQ